MKSKLKSLKPKRRIDSTKQRTRKKVGGFQFPRYKLNRKMLTVHDRRPHEITYAFPQNSTTHEIPKAWKKTNSMHLKGDDIVHGLDDYGEKYKFDIMYPFSHSRDFSKNVLNFDFKILGGAWQNLNYFAFFFEVMNANEELKWVSIFVNTYHLEVCYYDSEGEDVNIDVWYFFLKLAHEGNLFLFKQKHKLDQDAKTEYDMKFLNFFDLKKLQIVLESEDRIEPYRMLNKIIHRHHNNEEDPSGVKPYESESGIFALYFITSMLGGESYEEFTERNLDNSLMKGFRGRFFKDDDEIYKTASDLSFGVLKNGGFIVYKD